MSSEQSTQCQKHRSYCIDSKLDDIINMASTEDDKFPASSRKKSEIMEDTDIVEEHLDSPSYLALKSYYSGIRLVAIIQVCLSLLSITLASSILACSACGTRGTSAGSGVWCPIFFLVLAIMSYSNSDKILSLKVVCSFGFTAVYFALLMFVVEAIELITAHQALNLIAITLHALLCSIAAVVIALIIVSMVLHVIARKKLKAFRWTEHEEN